MTLDSNKKNGKRGIIITVLSAVVLTVLMYISAALVFGWRMPDISWLSSPFAQRRQTGSSSEFHFETGKNRVFADLGDGFASVGTFGLQVLDLSGAEIFTESFRMSTPAISEAGGKAVAYDIGGSEIRVFDIKGVITAQTAQGVVISASINQDGWFVVCTQESGGYKGAATVYNDTGKAVYGVESASGYVLSAAIPQGGKTLAVLALTDGGSTVTFYSMDRDGPKASFNLGGKLILDIMFLSRDKLLAVAKDALIIIDEEGSSTEIYNFAGRYLNGFCAGDGLIALHLLDYSVGNIGRLVVLKENGKITGEIVADSENISMSVKDGYLAVLWGGGLMFYDGELNGFLPYMDENLVAVNRVLALKGGGALVCGEYSAAVYEINKEAAGERSAGV